MVAAPSRLAGLQLVDPQHGDGWTHERIRAATPVPLGSSPAPLEVQIAGAGRMWTLPQWLAATHGTSLVVVHRGQVVHEWYAEDVSHSSALLGASMTKSVLATLVGIAMRAGALHTGDRVVDHVPELAGGGYAACTVRHLLTMTTGVDWTEDHRDPDSAASRLLAGFATGTGGSRDRLLEIAPAEPPGTRFEYCTADSQVLDWVRERATGSTYATALAQLWAALGCEHDAWLATDAPGGVALAGGGLAASARDWARVAMLQVTGTSVRGDRLLDDRWLEQSCAPPEPFLAPGRLPSGITAHAGFGYHWWPLDRQGRQVTADGSRGQFAYADRDLDVVVVKTSRWPYDDWLVDRQLRDLSYLGLPLIARAAAGGAAPTTSTRRHPG